MSVRRAFSAVLGFAGAVLLAIAIGANLERVGYQSWENRALDRQLREEPAAPARSRPGPVAPDGVVGRLTIPRLGISAIVRNGDSDAILRIALGHIPSTAFPGQSGNVGIAGHRDTLFRQLRHVRKSDVIWLETSSGKYAYEVQSLQIVKPSDVAVLQPGPSPELTLVTCYPFTYIGAAPDRFIVHASQISGAS